MRRSRRGLTLVEVAVVVVIIGILAVIAMVAYRRKVAAARVAEATNMINAIRKGQEAHKAETGVYANVSNSLAAFYPNETPGARLTQWGGPCSNCAGGDPRAWDKINVHADGPVLFGYATTAGVGGGAMLPNGPQGPEENEMAAAITSQNAVIRPTDPTFIAFAEADYNEDGRKCHVLGLSHSNHIIVVNEGD